MANQAAWMDANKAPIRVGEAEMYDVQPHTILVKNMCIAFNPMEAKIQKYSLFPQKYPSILGWSFAGTVSAVGPETSGFKVGDHVVVKRSLNANTNAYAAFQKYALATDFTATKLSDSTSLEDAAAVVLNLATAVGCLNASMGLDRPPVEGQAEANGKRVLIYGGSSSVGGLATRYISDAGYEVITTSSPKNESFVSSLGAKIVVDHTQSPDAVAAELKSHGPYDGILDCIGTPPVDMLMAKVLGETGGTYETMLPPMSEFKMPENVKRQMNSYTTFLETTHRDLGEFFYKEYLPKALVSGRIVPTRLEKVPGGLGGVQKALDLSLMVSGRKLIVDPWE